MKAFIANWHKVNNVVLEASLLAGAILQLAAKGTWVGTSEELLRRCLGARVGAADTRLAQDAPGNVRSIAPSRFRPRRSASGLPSTGAAAGTGLGSS
jgi:hypothetical protein